MKVLVIYPTGETKIMELDEICSLYRVTEKEVLWAIKSGHYLKTMLFDEVMENKEE